MFTDEEKMLAQLHYSYRALTASLYDHVCAEDIIQNKKESNPDEKN